MQYLEVRLHLGAHKTGSTLMQNELKRRKQHLNTRGISVVTPVDLRLRGAKLVVPNIWQKRISARVKQNISGRLAAARSNGAHKVVFSDEDMAGSIDGMLRGLVLYEHINSRISGLAGQFQHCNITIIFYVRSYASFFSTIYAHRTRRRPLQEFESFKAGFLTLSRRWPEVISDITRAFPGAKVLVMVFEDAIERSHAALCHLIGEPRLRQMNEDAPAVLPSPSAAAVEALNARKWPRRGSAAGRIHLANAYPRGEYDDFAPWSDSEKTMLDSAYREDLVYISNGGIKNVRIVDLSVLPKHENSKENTIAETSNAK